MKTLVLASLASLSLLQACNKDEKSNPAAQGYEPGGAFFYHPADNAQAVYVDAIGEYSCPSYGSGNGPKSSVSIGSELVSYFYSTGSGTGSAQEDTITSYNFFTGVVTSELRIWGEPEAKIETFQPADSAVAAAYRRVFNKLADSVKSCVEKAPAEWGNERFAPTATYLTGLKFFYYPEENKKAVLTDAVGTFRCGNSQGRGTGAYDLIEVKPEGTVTVTYVGASGGGPTEKSIKTYELFTGLIRTVYDSPNDDMPEQEKLLDPTESATSEDYKQNLGDIANSVNVCASPQQGVSGATQLVPTATYLLNIRN